jgi:hypothetical protein
MGERDCVVVARRLEQAWSRDAVAAMGLAGSDQFRRFVHHEGQRISEAWSQECAALVGRPTDSGELACLQKAQTIDDVYECAPR